MDNRHLRRGPRSGPKPGMSIWRRTFLLFAGLCLAASAVSAQYRRELNLRQLQQTLPASPEWEQWLLRSGELPPDFDLLPSLPYLPDPLRFQDGREVVDAGSWRERRGELRRLLEHWLTGTVPPPPGNLRSTVLAVSPQPGVEHRRVRLEFGPEHRGVLEAEMFVPAGGGPFPVIIGPAWTQSWARLAVRRGYVAVVYAGSDNWDQADALARVYPEYDFSLITRRAWAAHRIIDYLETVPETDPTRIGMWGHSRDGKQSLIAAAFDERIRAVIPSSSGSFGATPFRFVSEKYFSESIERKTRVDPTWFHPRLRFFVGREHKLPIDQNLLLALVAPRACLLSSAINDDNDGVFGVEQAYLSARRVWALLGQADRLGIRWRQQFHGTHPRDIEDYLDWFDLQFGRRTGTWKTELLFQFDHGLWQRESGAFVDPLEHPVRTDRLSNLQLNVRADWQAQAPNIQRDLEWLLGERPPLIRRISPPGTQKPSVQLYSPGRWWRRDVADDMGMVGVAGGGHYGWNSPERDRVAVRQFGFGDDLVGDPFYPREAPAGGRRMPVVIWLHGYSYMTGYQWAYREDLNPILAFTDRGFAVFAFELNGFGSRILEAGGFYRRYPGWSRMGAMVEDTRAALDLLETIDPLDSERVFIVGYSLGGVVGILTAALDSRPAGLVSICGFTPLRTDTPDKGTEGVRRYSHLHGLIPRLGCFLGHENRIPADFEEALALIAPRPVLVVAPVLDRDATHADVEAAIVTARRIYSLFGRVENLALYSPLDYNRFSGQSQQWVLDWMEGAAR
jgi:pimeloyl-ACP methyl ester carboxylesterase